MQPAKLDRFDPQTLALISQTTISGSYAMCVGFANSAYYIGLITGPIIVIDSTNLTVRTTFTSWSIQGIRGMIFLNNNRTMVITAINNQSIVFFNQTNSGSLSYSFAYQQSANYPTPHGLTRLNDTFFYATSYNNNSIYSYTAVQNSTMWSEKLVIDASTIYNISGGTFMTIDECGGG